MDGQISIRASAKKEFVRRFKRHKFVQPMPMSVPTGSLSPGVDPIANLIVVPVPKMPMSVPTGGWSSGRDLYANSIAVPVRRRSNSARMDPALPFGNHPSAILYAHVMKMSTRVQTGG